MVTLNPADFVFSDGATLNIHLGLDQTWSGLRDAEHDCVVRMQDMDAKYWQAPIFPCDSTVDFQAPGVHETASFREGATVATFHSRLLGFFHRQLPSGQTPCELLGDLADCVGLKTKGVAEYDLDLESV